MHSCKQIHLQMHWHGRDLNEEDNGCFAERRSKIMKMRINIWLDYYIIMKLLSKKLYPIEHDFGSLYVILKAAILIIWTFPALFCHYAILLSRLGVWGSLFCEDILLQWFGRIRGTSLFLKGCFSILPTLSQHSHSNVRSEGQASEQGRGNCISFNGFIDVMICNETKQREFLHINTRETGFSFYFGAGG